MTIVLNGSTWNFQELIRASVPTKRVSRNFDFSNLRSGQFSDQTIIRQREYLKMLRIPNVRGKSSYMYQDWLAPGHSRWPIYRFDPMISPSGHSRSYEVKCVFFPMTFDRIRLEHWGWFSCVSLTETHRQICNMTYLGHHVTSRDLDLRSNFGIIFF